MPIHLSDLRRLVRKASENGARRLTLGRWEWDVAGSCQSPVTREYFARKDRDLRRENDWQPGDEMPLALILHARCRHCQDCRRLRRRQWTLRAIAEARAASRNWFGTLTLNPEQAFRLEMVSRARLARGGTTWERLPPPDRFREVCREVGQELTRYLKRLRKESGARLRYMACFEPHRSMVPHLHVLLHESGDAPVRKRQLDAQWRLGFSHWRLVAEEDRTKSAAYVAKYVAKEGGRVRASILYGEPSRPRAIAPNEVSRVTPEAITTTKHRFLIGDRVAMIQDTADW